MDARLNGTEVEGDVVAGWKRLSHSINAERSRRPEPPLSDFERRVITALCVVHAVAAASIAVARLRADRRDRTL